MLRIRGHLKHSYAGSMIVQPHKPHEAICLKPPPLDVGQSPPGLFDRETQISDISRLQTSEIGHLGIVALHGAGAASCGGRCRVARARRQAARAGRPEGGASGPGGGCGALF